MIVTKNHPYNKKSSSYIYKLSSEKKFRILTLYIQHINGNKTFKSITHLANHFKINPKRPSKIKSAFDNLRFKFYPNKPINYSINIFSIRNNLTFHYRNNLSNKQLKLLTNFIKLYNRAWRNTYSSYLSQHWFQDFIVSKSTFIYHKPIICSKLWINYKHKQYHNKKQASQSKSFFNNLYKHYDLIFNLDWKSLEDIHTIQSNPSLSSYFKRISQIVEIQSGTIIKLTTEKSHNKTNALFIIKDIIETCQSIFGNNIKILFITDAWSEYLNNKKLRGLVVTSLDSSWIAKYLKNNNSDLMITRFKQDNWYIENKNKYIEIACLDNPSICSMDKTQFIESLQSYMDLNNNFLKWSNKFVYRWFWNTPRDNLISRFWQEKTDRFLSNLSVNHIESKHKLDDRYSKLSIFSLTQLFYPFLPILQPFIFSSKKTFPIRLDSSKYIFLIQYEIHYHIYNSYFILHYI